MSHYRNSTFPPRASWDARLNDVACAGLLPVETLHRNPWYAVRNRGGYFTLEYHMRHVAVLPVVAANSVVMVRVKRPVIDDLPLELPAGGAETDEAPAAAAARELLEETGIDVAGADRYIPMPPIAVSSARMPRLSYIFRVDVSEHEYARRRPHDDEVHSVERIPIDDLAGMMMRGEIYVSVPLAVLGLFLVSRNV